MENIFFGICPVSLRHIHGSTHHLVLATTISVSKFALLKSVSSVSDHRFFRLPLLSTTAYVQTILATASDVSKLSEMVCSSGSVQHHIVSNTNVFVGNAEMPTLALSPTKHPSGVLLGRSDHTVGIQADGYLSAVTRILLMQKIIC